MCSTYPIQLIFSKSFKNLHLEKLKFCSIKKNKFFMYTADNKKIKFLSIPDKIFFHKKKKALRLVSCRKESYKKTKFYFYTLINWLKNINRTYKRLLILRGLGLKIILSENKKELSFKLGYSHLVRIKIPSSIVRVNVKKNRLSLTAENLAVLRQFAKKIKFFRRYNIYNGRGFAYRREIKKYKTFKKK